MNSEKCDLIKVWEMWSQLDGDMFLNIGEKWWVKLYGDDCPIVPVIVAEEKDGEYFGWIDHENPIPSMIWRGEGLFNMCFPYGYRAEEEVGHGKHIQLSVSIDTTRR